jgi:predicted dehydrogenase
MDKISTAVIGCGNVSESYLPHLIRCPFVEVVGVCDLVEDRYRRWMAEFHIPRGFRNIGDLLGGVEFDFLVNLTSMPEHYGINRKALAAGKHVFSEKPFAPTYARGKELLDLARQKGVRLWAAPNAVTSPQFRCMAEILARGEIGEVHAAHGCYGHGGPTWGPWFYKPGGGCIGDLAVYNATTLTGLLGPANAVTALVGTAIRERVVEGEPIPVEAEDNAMLLLDHGHAVFSHIQTGFVYGAHFEDHTIELIGTRGALNLLGWDWAPRGVAVWREGANGRQTRCTDPEGYVWQGGAAYAASGLVQGTKGLMIAEHALHVVDVMEAALESARSGRKILIKSTFPWPII